MGGAGSPNTAELYNWRTCKQCQLPDLPVGVYGHVAASLDGVPVFCEAGANRRSCYKMDKSTKKWLPVSMKKYQQIWESLAYCLLIIVKNHNRSFLEILKIDLLKGCDKVFKDKTIGKTKGS